MQKIFIFFSGDSGTEDDDQQKATTEEEEDGDREDGGEKEEGRQGRTLVVSSLPGNPPWQSDSALS